MNWLFPIELIGELPAAFTHNSLKKSKILTKRAVIAIGRTVAEIGILAEMILQNG